MLQIKRLLGLVRDGGITQRPIGRLHEEQDPYKCTINNCNRVFSSMKSLKKHQVTWHNSKGTESQTEQMLRERILRLQRKQKEPSGPNGEASEGRAREQQTVEEGERRVSSATHDSTACRFKGEEVDFSVASSNGTDA